MANYSTKLKTWGSVGAEYPDAYNLAEDEPIIDAWENFLRYHSIKDVAHLIDLTNKRLETDSGTSHPASPEPGHLSHLSSDQTLSFWDDGALKWRRLLKADGDKMTGALDMGGNQIHDTTGPLSLAVDTQIGGAGVADGWFNKQEGGTVPAGALVVLGSFSLQPGETLNVMQATLTEDGFTTPCVSGVDLIIADEDDEADPATATPTTVLSGDGLTLYGDETGTPLVSYENTGTAAKSVVIALDNGHYNAGTSVDEMVYGGYIARIE